MFHSDGFQLDFHRIVLPSQRALTNQRNKKIVSLPNKTHIDGLKEMNITDGDVQRQSGIIKARQPKYISEISCKPGMFDR